MGWDGTGWDEQEAKSKADYEAMLNRMCELEQMVDDAGGASELFNSWGRTPVGFLFVSPKI